MSNQARLPDTRPASLLECQLMAEQQRKDFIYPLNQFYDRQCDERRRFLSWMLEDSSDDEEGSQAIAPKPKRQRRTKKVYLYSVNANGERLEVDARQSPWYLQYIVSPDLDKPKFHMKFRRRFRLPYESFLELLELVRTSEEEDGLLYFRRWMSRDAVGTPSSPIELMLLGSLRYLGRGWTFDDIEEATCISEESHRQFFDSLTSFGRKVSYQKWVVAPQTASDAEQHIHEMALAGSFKKQILLRCTAGFSMEAFAHQVGQVFLGSRVVRAIDCVHDGKSYESLSFLLKARFWFGHVAFRDC